MSPVAVGLTARVVELETASEPTGLIATIYLRLGRTIAAGERLQRLYGAALKQGPERRSSSPRRVELRWLYESRGLSRSGCASPLEVLLRPPLRPEAAGRTWWRRVPRCWWRRRSGSRMVRRLAC